MTWSMKYAFILHFAFKKTTTACLSLVLIISKHSGSITGGQPFGKLPYLGGDPR